MSVCVSVTMCVCACVIWMGSKVRTGGAGRVGEVVRREKEREKGWKGSGLPNQESVVGEGGRCRQQEGGA